MQMNKLSGVARRAGMAVTACCALALVALCYWAAQPWLSEGDRAVNAAVTPAQTPAPDPMAQFRTEREQLRSMQLGQLEEMAASEQVEGAARQAAAAEILDVTRRMEAETMLEGILAARGFTDCLVTVQEESVNVLVRGAAVDARQSAVILDAAADEIGASPEHIKIIPIN